jgi:hypothetical protein
VAVAALLRAAVDAVAAELAGLPREVAAWHPGPGAWCVLETIGHLVEAEQRGFAGRVREILAGGEPALAPWDQAAVGAARGDCRRDPADVLAELARARDASVRLVAGLGEADLARGGVHPAVGRLTVRDLLQEWVHHDREHLRQILANVQAYAWPHMGNARRFSEP